MGKKSFSLSKINTNKSTNKSTSTTNTSTTSTTNNDTDTRSSFGSMPSFGIGTLITC